MSQAILCYERKLVAFRESSLVLSKGLDGILGQVNQVVLPDEEGITYMVTVIQPHFKKKKKKSYSKVPIAYLPPT